MLDELEKLALQVSYLIPFIWFCCEGYFKGSPLIKYTYFACLKVVLWFVLAIYGLFLFHRIQRRVLTFVKRLRWSFFPKLVNNWKLLTFIPKTSTLDVWQGPEYASVNCKGSVKGSVNCLTRICYILQFGTTCFFCHFSQLYSHKLLTCLTCAYLKM